jgi:hypothetical protein
MDQDAKAMMGSMAQAMLRTADVPSDAFATLLSCMRGPCQQEISKCRQGSRSPCPPKHAKAQARAMCDDLRVKIMLRETARCNTNAKIAQGVKMEIAKRAKAQGLPDTPQVKEAMLAAEMDMMREMGQQCATTATANDPEYVDCMQGHQSEFMAACAEANCQQRMAACARQKCAGIFTNSTTRSTSNA